MDERFDLQGYLSTMLRWWWLFLALPLVAVLIFFQSQPELTPVYKATARILPQPGSLFGPVVLERRLANTYAELMTESDMLQKVAENLELKGLTRDSVRAIVVGETPILEIIATSSDPVLAAKIANTLGAVFITTTQDRRLQEIAMLQARASAFGVADPGWALSQQIALMGSFSIIREAAPPTLPIPRKTRWSGLAYPVMLSLIGAIASALLLEHLAGKVRGPATLERQTGSKPVGVIPKWSAWRSGKRSIVVAVQPESAAAEAYRQIVVRLYTAHMGADAPPKAFVITSGGAMEGKSTTAANLAAAMAETGRSVILVDGDLWRPDLHKWFDVTNGIGLGDLLNRPDPALGVTLHPTSVAGLRLLTSGSITAPANPLGRESIARTVEALKKEGQVIIFDCPPIQLKSFAVLLASSVDGVLLVADAARTTTESLAMAMSSVAMVRSDNMAEFWGIVLNRLPISRFSYYRKYGYYGRYFTTNGKTRRVRGASPGIVAKVRELFR